MNKMTTSETLTDEQIETLSDEAAQANDFQQVELCRQALDGNLDPMFRSSARAACLRAINDAEAQSDFSF